MRALDPVLRDQAVDAIIAEAQAIAARRGIGFEAAPIQDLPASPCDQHLMDLLADAMGAEGHPDRRLASGAGHDAMVMAALCPTAMLFIRCARRHQPQSCRAASTAEDADTALRVMRRFPETGWERQCLT